MTTEQILAGIETSKQAIAKAFADKVEALRVEAAADAAKQDKLMQATPKLVATLEEQGLAIVQINTHGLTAKPTNKKFRFLVFRGFDARGASRNQEAHNTKAAKMSEQLSAATGLRMQVNQASLELRTAEENKSVLISFSL